MLAYTPQQQRPKHPALHDHWQYFSSHIYYHYYNHYSCIPKTHMSSHQHHYPHILYHKWHSVKEGLKLNIFTHLLLHTTTYTAFRTRRSTYTRTISVDKIVCAFVDEAHFSNVFPGYCTCRAQSVSQHAHSLIDASPLVAYFYYEMKHCYYSDFVVNKVHSQLKGRRVMVENKYDINGMLIEIESNSGIKHNGILSLRILVFVTTLALFITLRKSFSELWIHFTLYNVAFPLSRLNPMIKIFKAIRTPYKTIFL